MNTPSTIAIIPARGGSKGIIGKNTRSFLGRPLVQHSILHALQCSAVSNVYVSTDCPVVTELAKNVGADVINRPAELSGDTASSESALLHALETVIGMGETLPQRVIFLQATSPLRRAHDLDDALHVYAEEQADCLVSVTPSHDFYWSQSPGCSAVAQNYVPAQRPRRQDMTPQYRENGSFYIFSGAGFMHHKCRIFGKVSLHVMPEELSCQIDTMHDWDLIEHIALRTGLGHSTRFAA